MWPLNSGLFGYLQDLFWWSRGVFFGILLYENGIPRPRIFGSGQMGSYANGVGRISPDFNRILTGFDLLDPARVRPVPSATHDFKGFRPDFNRILTGL